MGGSRNIYSRLRNYTRGKLSAEVGYIFNRTITGSLDSEPVV